MWSEELVRRAHEEVGADAVEVGEAMLRQVHAVDRDEGADGFRTCHEVGGRRDGADGIGGEGERDQLRARGESGLEGLDIDRDVIIADVHPPHGGARVGRGQHPRAHVRVVVQAGHDHFVLRTERLREGPGDVEQQRRRVRTEDDSSGSAPVKSAAARRASAMTPSVSWLVANAPCVLLIPRR